MQCISNIFHVQKAVISSNIYTKKNQQKIQATYPCTTAKKKNPTQLFFRIHT